MKFTISAEIFEKFPELNIAAIIVRVADNHGFDQGIVKLLLLVNKKFPQAIFKI